MCFSFALLSFGALCAATGFYFCFISFWWVCAVHVFAFLRFAVLAILFHWPIPCERESSFNVCEYDLSTCIDISFTHSHWHRRSRKKMFTKLRLCIAWTKPKICVRVNIGHFRTKDTHTHILGLWFNNSLLRLFYVFLFGFGILVVAAAAFFRLSSAFALFAE